MFRRLSMKNGAIERCSIKKCLFVDVTFSVRICIVSLRHTWWSIKSFWELLATSFSFFFNFSSLLFNVNETANPYHGYLWRESSARKITAKKEDRGCIDGFPSSSWFHSGYFGDSSRYHVEQTIARSSSTSDKASVFLKVSSGDVYWKRDKGEHVTL